MATPKAISRVQRRRRTVSLPPLKVVKPFVASVPSKQPEFTDVHIGNHRDDTCSRRVHKALSLSQPSKSKKVTLHKRYEKSSSLDDILQQDTSTDAITIPDASRKSSPTSETSLSSSKSPERRLAVTVDSVPRKTDGNRRKGLFTLRRRSHGEREEHKEANTTDSITRNSATKKKWTHPFSGVHTQHTMMHTSPTIITQAPVISYKTFLVPQKEVCRIWTEEKAFELVDDYVELSGYCAYIVTDWLLTNKFFTTVIEETGNDDDRLFLAIIRIPVKELNSREQFIVNNFLTPKSGKGVVKKTGYGKVFVSNKSVLAKTNVFKVPQRASAADIDVYVRQLELSLTLQRLGCFTTVSIHQDKDAEAEFYQAYAVRTSVPIIVAAKEIVKRIQGALCNLNFLPLVREVKGRYGEETMHAVKALQTWIFKKGEKVTIDGLCTPKVYVMLQALIEHVAKALKDQQISMSGEPFKMYKEFNTKIRSFYAAQGIYPVVGVSLLHVLKDELSIPVSLSIFKRAREKRGSMHVSPSSEKVYGRDLLRLPMTGSHDVTELRLKRSVSTTSKRHSGGKGSQVKFGSLRKTQKKDRETTSIHDDVLSAEEPAEGQYDAYVQSLVDHFRELIERRDEQYLLLQNDYDDLEVGYYELQEEAQEAVGAVKLFELKLEEVENNYKKLHKDFELICEILKQNGETLEGYFNKSEELEENIQQMARKQQRNILRQFLFYSVLFVLGTIGLLVFGFLWIVDRIQSTGDTQSDLSGRFKRYCDHQQKKFELFLDTLERQFSSALFGSM